MRIGHIVVSKTYHYHFTFTKAEAASHYKQILWRHLADMDQLIHAIEDLEH